MPLIQTPGPITVFTSTAGSTVKTGDWYQVHPSITDWSWQATLAVSSAGATASSTVKIEVTNSTAVAVQTAGQTIALTGTTDLVSDGATLATSMKGHWSYFRANMTSLTTSTAGSAGSPIVNVIFSGNQRAL